MGIIWNLVEIPICYIDISVLITSPSLYPSVSVPLTLSLSPSFPTGDTEKEPDIDFHHTLTAHVAVHTCGFLGQSRSNFGFL